MKELIDTLWNVNYFPDRICQWAILELIDTLWNVNGFELIQSNTDGRINRYIMECKLNS